MRKCTKWNEAKERRALVVEIAGEEGARRSERKRVDEYFKGPQRCCDYDVLPALERCVIDRVCRWMREARQHHVDSCPSCQKHRTCEGCGITDPRVRTVTVAKQQVVACPDCAADAREEYRDAKASGGYGWRVTVSSL